MISSFLSIITIVLGALSATLLIVTIIFMIALRRYQLLYFDMQVKLKEMKENDEMQIHELNTEVQSRDSYIKGLENERDKLFLKYEGFANLINSIKSKVNLNLLMIIEQKQKNIEQQVEARIDQKNPTPTFNGSKQLNGAKQNNESTVDAKIANDATQTKTIITKDSNYDQKIINENPKNNIDIAPLLTKSKNTDSSKAELQVKIEDKEEKQKLKELIITEVINLLSNHLNNKLQSIQDYYKEQMKWNDININFFNMDLFADETIFYNNIHYNNILQNSNLIENNAYYIDGSSKQKDWGFIISLQGDIIIIDAQIEALFKNTDNIKKLNQKNEKKLANIKNEIRKRLQFLQNEQFVKGIKDFAKKANPNYDFTNVITLIHFSSEKRASRLKILDQDFINELETKKTLLCSSFGFATLVHFIEKINQEFAYRYRGNQYKNKIFEDVKHIIDYNTLLNNILNKQDSEEDSEQDSDENNSSDTRINSQNQPQKQTVATAKPVTKQTTTVNQTQKQPQKQTVATAKPVTKQTTTVNQTQKQPQKQTVATTKPVTKQTATVNQTQKQPQKQTVATTKPVTKQTATVNQTQKQPQKQTVATTKPVTKQTATVNQTQKQDNISDLANDDSKIIDFLALKNSKDSNKKHSQIENESKDFSVTEQELDEFLTG